MTNKRLCAVNSERGLMVNHDETNSAYDVGFAIRLSRGQSHLIYQPSNDNGPRANGTQLAPLYKGDYSKWLTSVNPQIVVISRGLLNDAGPKTPFAKFQDHIRQEITLALAHHAVVFLVTPPVTKASYTQFKIQQQKYVNSEIVVAKQCNSPKVYVFNLFGQMKGYLLTHNLTYVPYMGDAWHPNTAGHILASKLLVRDVVKKFGNHPIEVS